jgi:hypothetical protein
MCVSIAHDLRVGYMLTFEKIGTREYHMSIFDYSCCEVVMNCLVMEDRGGHGSRVIVVGCQVRFRGCEVMMVNYDTMSCV